MENNKARLKVGDRVRLIDSSKTFNGHLSNGMTGTVRYVQDDEDYPAQLCVEFDNWHHGHGGGTDNLNIPNDSGWYIHENYVEKINTVKYPVITITTDGCKTMATMRREHEILRTASVKCHPDDVYDYKTGVTMVLDRLLDGLEIETKPKYFTGDAVYLGGAPFRDVYTVGKIYHFENGYTRDNDGNLRPFTSAIEENALSKFYFLAIKK